ncbi:MAG: alanine racemase [Eubacteriales bacterium]|nr:alanine racemase [Eubacteriales bacterium]
MKGYDRVWAQIDLDAFLWNLREMEKNIAPDTSLIGVVKTDGYGHGAVPLAKEMERDEKVSGFAVATAAEGIILRRAGITKPILVLGYTFPAEYEDMIREEIRAAVFTDEMLSDMKAAARRLQKNMIVHIAVDTGMSRIGVRPDDSGLAFVKRAFETPGLTVEGIFTHFARADEADKASAYEQLHQFAAFTERIRAELGLTVPVVHCSNSAGILELREANMSAVRAGIILYGLWPSEEVGKDIVSLKPVLSLYSHVAFVKELEAGRQISYGGTFTTPHNMRVATIPVGYGDGYPRGLSNVGDVLINGKRARILGRICMDQFMVDVTKIPDVRTGTKVTLIGRDMTEQITMEELGEKSGRFNYELACCLGKRIPRIYQKGGNVISTKDYFSDYE